MDTSTGHRFHVLSSSLLCSHFLPHSSGERHFNGRNGWGEMLDVFDTTQTCTPGFLCAFGVRFLTPILLTPVNGVITVGINGEAETFHFRYVTGPVTVTPEPSTLALFGTGLAAIGCKIRKTQRRQKFRSPSNPFPTEVELLGV